MEVCVREKPAGLDFKGLRWFNLDPVEAYNITNPADR